MAVSEDLDLDVARVIDVLFDEQRAVAKRALPFASCRSNGIAEASLFANELHPLATTAGACFQENGEADLYRFLGEHGRGLVRAVVSGNHRHPGLRDEGFGFALGSHRPNRIGSGADEDHPGARACIRECGVLGEEAIAGVDGIASGQCCRFENLVDAQIALRARSRPQPDCLVGFGYERHGRVRVGVDRNRRDAHLPAGPHDATCDFASIGYQDLLNRCGQRPLAP